MGRRFDPCLAYHSFFSNPRNTILTPITYPVAPKRYTNPQPTMTAISETHKSVTFSLFESFLSETSGRGQNSRCRHYSLIINDLTAISSFKHISRFDLQSLVFKQKSVNNEAFLTFSMSYCGRFAFIRREI